MTSHSTFFKVGAMAPLGFFDPAGFSKVGDKVPASPGEPEGDGFWVR